MSEIKDLVLREEREKPQAKWIRKQAVEDARIGEELWVELEEQRSRGREAARQRNAQHWEQEDQRRKQEEERAERERAQEEQRQKEQRIAEGKERRRIRCAENRQRKAVEAAARPAPNPLTGKFNQKAYDEMPDWAKRAYDRSCGATPTQPHNPNTSTSPHLPPKPKTAWELFTTTTTKTPDYTSLTVFPSPPAQGRCENPYNCASKAYGRALKACDCQIKAAVKKNPGLHLKDERVKWHSDKFSACEE